MMHRGTDKLQYALEYQRQQQQASRDDWELEL